MAERLRIELLADHPDTLETVASWEKAEWGHLMPTVSLQQITNAFAKRANRDRIPMTLLGYLDTELVGTVSLVAHDMDGREDLSPWLAIMYVKPAQRRQGFGSQLVGAAMHRARSLGIDTLYLFTPDQMAFYERCGWQVDEVMNYRGERVSIMSCRLNA